MKQTIRRIIGRAIRQTYDYARSLAAQAAPVRSLEVKDPESYEYSYLWLNDILAKLMLENPSLRPHYTWGVLQGAYLARALGMPRISVIEFGVAGGNGLVALEQAAEKVEEFLGVGIDVYGFDTGMGLPPSRDYRDLPNLFRPNHFTMDVDKLKARLTRAQLKLGLVGETIQEFIKSRPAPVGFVAIDLDYYSSTMDAFRLLQAEYSILLPRVYSYFDDIMAFTYSEFTGERLAISDFNRLHKDRKISPIFGLDLHIPTSVRNDGWTRQMYMTHFFHHPLYCEYDGLGARNNGFAELKVSAAAAIGALCSTWLDLVLMGRQL
jgi:hypothetical protein